MLFINISKMERLNWLRYLIQKGDWMIKLDKKDAYITVPIDPQHEIPIFVPPIWPKSRTFPIHQAFEPAVALLRSLGLRLIISLNDII